MENIFLHALKSSRQVLLFFCCIYGFTQGTTFQINAGVGGVDYRWDTPKRHPHEFVEGLPFNVSAEIGALIQTTDAQSLRITLGGSTGNISLQQIGLDYEWVLITRSSKNLYILVGPSINFLSGTYTFHNGFEPPDGQGDYRHIDQRWRPGARLGMGFQWSTHWAVEIGGHFIDMATTGAQGVPHSESTIVSVMISYRFK